MSFKDWFTSKDEWEKEKKRVTRNPGFPFTPMPPRPAPQWAQQESQRPDPLKPIMELEGGEVFVIRKMKEILAYCWLNFKEGEDWREFDDETMMIKSHVMAMIKLKFTKEQC
jgi:hypothetical protein